MSVTEHRVKIRKKRHARIRRTISGTEARPRLCVSRSLKHMIAQLIDDVSGTSIIQVSSTAKEFRTASEGKAKLEQAQLLGKRIGEQAVEKGITTVLFDRGGNFYHGRVKALADAAREAGLKF
ncbi:MAG: 50S ribosomal protein L18 [Fibrobacteria bacterium]|nr:50S ribosomal protein L18 [Fibrobacteria bacterium]